jgi:hypothetical protein
LEERKQTDAALRASGRSPYGLPSESEFSERVASIQQQLREQPGTRVAPQQWTPNYEPLAADSGQTLKEAEDAQQARYQARLQESDARDLLEKAMRPQPSGDPVRDVGIAQDRATAIAQLARSRGEDPEKVAEALMPGKTSADSDRKLNELTKQFLRGEPSDVALEQAVLNNSSPSKSSRDENADALTLMKNLGAKRARESEVETKKELADAKKLADERVNEDRDLKRQDLEEAKKEAATARKIDGLQRRIDSAEKRREKLLSDPVASKIEPAKSLISQIEKQMEDMQLQLDDLQDVSSDEVNETNSRADELLSKYAPKTNP